MAQKVNKKTDTAKVSTKEEKVENNVEVQPQSETIVQEEEVKETPQEEDTIKDLVDDIKSDDIEEGKQIIKDVSQSMENLDEISKTNDAEELKSKIEDELNKMTELEEKMEKKIETKTEEIKKQTPNYKFNYFWNGQTTD